jgi:phosphomevalonate kinase
MVLRIGAPIKRLYSEAHGLDYERFLDSSEYKEQYRKGAVDWSEAIREKDPGYFTRMAIDESNAKSKPVWVLVDARREIDVDFFNSKDYEKSRIMKIRVTASQEIRASRGWVFTPGIDDMPTECGLDAFEAWDMVLVNNDLTREQILQELRPVTEALQGIIC